MITPVYPSSAHRRESRISVVVTVSTLIRQGSRSSLDSLASLLFANFAEEPSGPATCLNVGNVDVDVRPVDALASSVTCSFEASA